MHRHRRVERVADHVGEVMVLEAAGFGEAVGMDEDQGPQLLAAREDRAEARRRQVLAGDMRHDLDAAEAQRFMQPLQFGHGQFRGLERDRAEPDEAVGKAADSRRSRR